MHLSSLPASETSDAEQEEEEVGESSAFATSQSVAPTDIVADKLSRSGRRIFRETFDDNGLVDCVKKVIENPPENDYEAVRELLEKTRFKCPDSIGSPAACVEFAAEQPDTSFANQHYQFNVSNSALVVDLYKLDFEISSYILPNGTLGVEMDSWRWPVIISISIITALMVIFLNIINFSVLYYGTRGELRRYLINLSIGDLLIGCIAMRK